MAVERRIMVHSRRTARLLLLAVGLLVASLIGWNVLSAPQLSPATGRGNAPTSLDYNASFSFESNPRQAASSNGRGQNLLPSGANGPANFSPIVEPPEPTARPTPTTTPTPPRPSPEPNLPPQPAQPLPPNSQDLLPGSSSLTASATNKPANFNSSSVEADPTGPAQGRIVARGAELVDARGLRYFVAGINYEGHTDRAWLMWQDDKWDAGLVDQNFALAAGGGYNSIRIFIQTPLRDDIKANDFSKLDKTAELAQKHGLRLLITFADYYEPDLNKLVEIDMSVARHFARSPAILGYDLRNEPQFSELVAAIYPGDKRPPLQSEEMIKIYGERISQAETDNWRQGAGSTKVPGHLNGRQGYIYANIMRIYEEFQLDIGHWVNRNGRATALDFFNTTDAAKWRPFIEALDGTVQRYIAVRQGAIHLADPGRLTTIGWNRPDLARSPANRLLGFVSFHRFPGDSAGGLAGTLAMLDHLKNFYSGKPVVLEEFGYSNHYNGKDIGLLQTASYETSVWLFLYGRGYAGGFKWMLHNFTLGANPYENNFGLTDHNTRPKPSYYAARSVLRMATANRTPVGDFGRLESYDGATISYNWGSGNAFFGNSKEFRDNRIYISQGETAPWAVWWPSTGTGQVYFSTTAPARVSIDLRAIFPGWRSGMQPVISLNKLSGWEESTMRWI